MFLWHFINLFFEDEGKIELSKLLYHLDYLICNVTRFVSILQAKFVLVRIVSNGDA